jgi:MoaA/NifB/PqqE/SkfB family radical SAM enzyme
MCTNCDSYILDPDEKYGLDKHRAKIREFKNAPDDRTVFYRNGEHSNYFLFTGGEPTLHPEFFKLLGEYRRNFPETPFTLLTNGRSFFYDEFARNTLKLGGTPFDVAVPVHGPDARTHDSVTRAPGSFVETIEGLKNLFKHRVEGQRLEIRVILHKNPTRWLDKTLRFLLKTYPNTEHYRLNLVYFEVEGQAEKNFRSIAITLGDCAKKVDACFELLGEFSEARLYHFPLCALSRRLWPYAWRTLPRYEIQHVDACRSCAVNDVCNGPHDWYAKFFGADEFKPFSERPALSLRDSFFHPIESVGEGTQPGAPAPIADEKKDDRAKW